MSIVDLICFSAKSSVFIFSEELRKGNSSYAIQDATFFISSIFVLTYADLSITGITDSTTGLFS